MGDSESEELEATQTAQEDFDAAMASDSDYEPSESSSIVAITASLCEQHQNEQTDSESESDDDPFRFSMPSTSQRMTQGKRRQCEPPPRDDSTLTHLTPLNAKGLSKRQRTVVKDLREKYKKEMAEKRKQAKEARQAERAARQPERKLRSWSVTLAFNGRDIPAQRLAEWNNFVLQQVRGISASERGGTCQNLHAQAAIELLSTGVRTLRREIISALGWDTNPPQETFKMSLREIDGSKGLYESFDAFTGYIQNDSGLYADWSFVHTDSVTDDMLTTGSRRFSLSVLWLSFLDF